MTALVLFVDLDEWFHCRWATGAVSSRWSSVRDCLRDSYGSDEPAGEIAEPTRWILDCLREYSAKATFAILGEVAEWYPELVKEIAQGGHEIACHGMHHRDTTLIPQQQFSEELARARSILEDLSGRSVVGFRAPNLVITEWLPRVLIEQGFAYDSSVCPARYLQKFREHSHAPTVPYHVSLESLCQRGDTDLIEMPISVVPILRFPGGQSIITRILGWTWTRFALDSALRSGYACYYAHPYEFNPAPRLHKMTIRERIFMRRTGEYMKQAFRKLLQVYEGRVVTAQHYVSQRSPGKVAAGSH